MGVFSIVKFLTLKRTKKMKKTESDLYFNQVERFNNTSKCLKYIFQARARKEQGGCPICNCHFDNFRPIATRMAFQCPNCQYQVYPLANTCIEGTRKLDILFQIMMRAVSAKYVIPSLELTSYEISHPTAIDMNRKIHDLMFATISKRLSGTVSVDEMWFNVETGLLRKKRIGEGKELTKDEKRQGKTNEILLIGMVEQNGNSYCDIIPTADEESLIPMMEKHIDKDSTIVTDGWAGYNGVLRAGFAKHVRVKHKDFKFVAQGVSSNPVESFWRNLRSSWKPIRSFTPMYIRSYLCNRMFHHNYRSLSNEEKFDRLIAQMPPLLDGRRRLLVESK
jgi:transposase-like protein